jgi:hypothetical protein
MNKVILSEEIVWCHGDDRHVLIKRVNGDIDGLNYCQGDDLEYFLDNFNEIDEDLTNFFKAIEPYLVHEDQIDRINAAIWARFEYRNFRDEKEYNNNLNK